MCPAIIFAGGVFSWLVLMPAIYFFGSHLPDAALSRHDADQGYVALRAMGAPTSGPWAQARSPPQASSRCSSTLPTILGALTQGCERVGKQGRGSRGASRTEHDLPMSVVVFGVCRCWSLLMFLFLQFKPVPGA